VCVYIYIYGIFYKAVSISEYTAPYSTMSVSDELQTIWRVTVIPKSK